MERERERDRNWKMVIAPKPPRRLNEEEEKRRRKELPKHSDCPEYMNVFCIKPQANDT